MTSDLLPFQPRSPFAWPIDPTAPDPSKHPFWIAWAAAKCASEPSVEALWGKIFYAAYALLRMKEALEPFRSDPAGIRSCLAELGRTYGRHLPRRCFRPRPGDEAVGSAIAIGQIAETVDVLAEALIEGWDIRSIVRCGNCDDAFEDPHDLLRRIRVPGARFSPYDSIMGRVAYAVLNRRRASVPHAGLPMPWAASLLSAVERVTGACETECAMTPSQAGLAYLLRDAKPECSMLFRFDLQEDGGPQLLPAGAQLSGDGVGKNHPLFPFFGDDLPKFLDEYRAWRTLAGKPIFQDTCKWHPDDEEIA